jgi:hypothetical protein
MRKATATVVTVLAIMACDSTPAPRGVEPPVPLPAASISDAAYGGAGGFYFLPPIVRPPAYSGTFDGTAVPIVEICESPDCFALHASFSMDEGSGSARVRRSEADEHYIVNWHTDATGAQVGNRYRIRVRAGATTLGYADVELAANGRAARNATSDLVIGLVAGRTLPITFRIERSDGFRVGPAGGTLTALNGAVRLELAEFAVVTEITVTIQPVADEIGDPDVLPGAVYEFGPSPYNFGAPVALTVLYDAAALPAGMDAAELRMLKRVDDAWIQIPGSTVDVAASRVVAPLQGFSRFAVGRGKVHDVAVTPVGAAIPIGGTQQFEAMVTNVDGEAMSRNVQWSSSDAGVASVDGHGLVTALALGEATIEARVGNVRGSAEVTVEAAGPAPRVATRIEVAPASASITVGGTQQFAAIVHDQYDEVMADEAVVWTSSDEAVATVGVDGLAAGVGAGEATITATAGASSGNGVLAVAPVAYSAVGNWRMEVMAGTDVHPRFVIISNHSNGEIDGFFGIGYDPGGEVTGTITGTISGNMISMSYDRTGYADPDYRAWFDGTIAEDGNSMTGTWTDNRSYPSPQQWSMARQ